MSLDAITGGMRTLLNNNEITTYERSVLQSMLDQATRRGRLSDKQVKYYNNIASNYTENALADKREWETTFVGKKLEDLRVIARYYKKQGSYFLALVDKILSDEGYVPNRSQYRKLCENKYAQKVLIEHHKEPRFDVGQQVYVRSKSPYSRLAPTVSTPGARVSVKFDPFWGSNLRRGAIVLRANAEPIENSCKGAKKYLVLPIGEPHGIVIEERWLKSRRDKKNGDQA